MGTEPHIVMPIKALTKDSFSRDIFVRERSSQRIKRERGKFINAFALYGYRKSDENKNLLVPDNYAAGIVRGILAKKVSGYNASRIADKIGILFPEEYKKFQGHRFSTGFKRSGKTTWSAPEFYRRAGEDHRGDLRAWVCGGLRYRRSSGIG